MTGKEFYVYRLEYPNGRPFYVGKGCGRRAITHEGMARKGKSTNPEKLRIIQKILDRNQRVRVVIVRRFTDEDQAFKFERRLIRKLGRKPNGPLVNMTDGGDGVHGYHFTANVRKKLSAASKGRPKSASHRKNIADGIARSAAFWEAKRRPVRQSTREKLSKIHLGRKRPLATRQAIAEGNRRRGTLPAASRKKISESLKKFYARKRRG